MNGQRALLVCPRGRGADKLKPLMAANGLRDALVAASGAEARRMAAETAVDAVVVNAPLDDESGLELAMELTENSTAVVILLVRAELMGVVFGPATEAGVLTVGKPLNPALFAQAIQLGATMQSRLRVLSRRYEKLEQKLEELRTVDRAKLLLIQRKKLTEEEAHRLIEKRAMDMRLSKTVVARELIRQFEL